MRTSGIEIFYWIESWNAEQTEYFSNAQDCGFDAVEISLVSGPEIHLETYRDALSKHNLAVYCSMGLPQEKDITSPNLQTRQAGIDYLKRCCETASKLGSPLLGGLPYVPWLYFPKADDLQPYRDRAAESLREVAITASDNGISLCLEIINRFETFMFNTVEEGLVFLNQIDHAAIKLQLDTYHMNMEEDNLADAIKLAGRHLGHFHCAASNRKLPGQGHIDWAMVREALDDIDYGGGVIIEVFPNPQAETGRTVNTWRPLVHNYDEELIQARKLIQKQLIEAKS